MKEITQKELKDIISYDPDTGMFTWICSGIGKINLSNAGSVITKETGKKYIHISILNKRYYAHRLAWLYIYGRFPEDQIDHINGNGVDNRLCNLRSVDAYENHKNKKRDARNRSGITGVRWNKADKHWVAQITVKKKQIHLGCSKSLLDIACIRKSAEIEFGFHKNHGSDRPL